MSARGNSADDDTVNVVFSEKFEFLLDVGHFVLL